MKDKMLVWGCSISRSAVSNPAESMDVGLLCLLCFVWIAAYAARWLLVQQSPIGWACLTVSNLGTSKTRRPRPDLECWVTEENVSGVFFFLIRTTGSEMRTKIFRLHISGGAWTDFLSSLHRGDIDGWFVMSFADGVRKSQLAYMNNGQQHLRYSQSLWLYLPWGLINKVDFWPLNITSLQLRQKYTRHEHRLIQEERQCRCKAILRRRRATTVTIEKQ